MLAIIGDTTLVPKPSRSFCSSWAPACGMAQSVARANVAAARAPRMNTIILLSSLQARSYDVVARRSARPEHDSLLQHSHGADQHVADHRQHDQDGKHA